MRAVGCVVRNRVRQRWYGGSFSRNITAPNQFTSISVRTDPLTTAWPAPSDPLWLTALEEADGIVTGVTQDVTGGALYYENPRHATSGWFVRNIRNNPSAHPVRWRHGRHVFYA